MGHAYLCIDLKCFYASVECVDRGYDPFERRLVVADPTRGPKTICLAVSPAMKAAGVRNRCRVFEIPDGISYEMAPPRMRRYMEVSANIYGLYLRYFSPEDIHVYSVDEVFIDVGPYLALYGKGPRELAVELIELVRRETGICATAGIGTNLFLAKVALDVTAKHAPDNIGELDEERFKCLIWPHRPITDIWGIGPGIARRLAAMGAHDLGGVALLPEKALYDEFGINAELLIDHAWGWEPTTIADIKAYKPESSSLGSGQVLTAAYPYEKARLVVREMAEELILNLVDKGLVTDQIDLTIGYDTASLTTPGIRYTGPVTTDHYGRKVPKHAHGTRHLGRRTQSAKVILDAAMALFDRIVNPALLVRRVNIVALHILVGQEELPVPEVEQLDLFTDYAKLEQERLAEQARLERESRIQQAALSIKRKFGKNALVKGMDLQEDATAMTRNNQIGGHKA